MGNDDKRPGHTEGTSVDPVSLENEQRMLKNELRWARQSQALTISILNLLNTEVDGSDAIREILGMVKEFTGLEAVAIRLREGDDFPYFDAQGFPADFVDDENSLCVRSDSGEVMRDSSGNPILACLCGDILLGRTRPESSCFTENGSFWTCSATVLFLGMRPEDREVCARNRCIAAGYESVALIPLRSGSETVGLLQLNDSRKNCFTLDMIHFIEGIGSSIGIVLHHKRAKELLRQNESKYKFLFEHTGNAVAVYKAEDEGEDFIFTDFNRAAEAIEGISRDDLLGRSVLQAFPRVKEFGLFEVLQRVWRTGNPESYPIALYKDEGMERWRDNFVYKLPTGEVVAIYTDETDHKKAEEALRASKAQLSNALEMAHLGHWEYDVATDTFTFNDQFYKIFRSTAEQVGGYTMSSADYAQRFVHPDEMYMVGEETRKAIETTDPNFNRQLEHRILYADGETGYISVRVFLVKDELGRTVRTYGVNQDITERKHAEERLAQTECRYQRLFEEAPLMYVITRNEDGIPFISDCNELFLRSVGYPREEVVEQPLANFYSDESRVELFEGRGYQRALAGAFFIGERQLLARDGRLTPTLLYTATEVDPSGNVTGTRAMFVDITERKKAQDALFNAQRDWEDTFNSINDMITIHDNNYNIIHYNKSAKKLLGLPAPVTTDAIKCYQYYHGKDCPPDACPSCQCLHTKRQAVSEIFEPHLNMFVEITAIPRVDKDSQLTGIVHIVRDITDRKRAEDNLRESEKKFRLVTETVQDVFWLSIPNIQQMTYVSPAYEKVWGRSTDSLYEAPESFLEAIHPDDRDRIRGIIQQSHAKGDAYTCEYRIVREDGSTRWILERGFPVYDAQGQHTHMCGVSTDITERKQAEEAREESERQYRSLFEDSIDGVYSVTRDGIVTDANASYCQLFGYPREEMIGKDIRELYLDPADRPKFQKAIEQKGFVKDYEIRFRKRDGTEVDCLITSSVHVGKDGNILEYRGILRDLTLRKELHRQLQQAQKMEAVGTLAGGIAHDFNNLLQVVLGYSELVAVDEDLPGRLRDDLGKVLLAARNGADLVQRLLTFSRKTETKPLDLDLNQRIRQTEKFLHRTIPKMIDIELTLADDLDRIHADPTQIDQVLMNLAVNARDAMPEGGRLVLETSNIAIDEEYATSQLEVEPGKYVLLRISDTGSGMDAETLEHIFEPFYTTKGVGQGTGLGLAMVFGIVKQHQGFIKCCSEIGQGTTFKIYLPSVVSETRLDLPTGSAMPSGGRETILLVDDEELIRDLGKRILRKAGYTVLTASNGREALEIYRKEQDQIALVILDLIMPEMGGKQCLGKLLKIDPQARVLIASGFTASEPMRQPRDMGARGFVGKPYNVKEMLQTIREILDSE
jgi:PAS domain S-box-containing protein